jgi:hypothetical protein
MAHLRLTKEPEGWTGAEINLTRRLGYGTYSFVIHELPKLEPATVLGKLSRDPLDAGHYHRAFDIFVGQFGDPAIKNGQYTLLPSTVPSNQHRFSIPPGAFTHSIRWERRRLSFQTQASGRQSHVDAHGRVGHHGLPGMAERAKLAGGKLSVSSRLNSGTELEVCIPASIVYATSPT